MRCAKKYLWDKDIAVAAVGRVEGLLDYSRCVPISPFASLSPSWSLGFLADSLNSQAPCWNDQFALVVATSLKDECGASSRLE